MGYNSAVIRAALDTLTATGLIQRSRNARGLRLYEMAALAEERRRHALQELIRLTSERDGRLQLINHLRQGAAVGDRQVPGGLRLV